VSQTRYGSGLSIACRLFGGNLDNGRTIVLRWSWGRAGLFFAVFSVLFTLRRDDRAHEGSLIEFHEVEVNWKTVAGAFSLMNAAIEVLATSALGRLLLSQSLKLLQIQQRGP
jgi:hypothetical protein